MNESRRKWLVIAALASVGILLGDKLVISPLARVWKERSDRITELRENVERGEQLVEREDFVRNRWRTMRSDALSRNLSEAENDVLKAVDAWARESGIRLTSIKPQWREMDEEATVLECRAGASGSMEEIARFLHEAETDPAAVRVDRVEIAARDDRGSDLSVNFRITGLVLRTSDP